MRYLVYATAGALFACGLLISGMANPQKVTQFLDLSSSTWTPQLLLVLLSAAAVYFLAFLWLRRSQKTWNTRHFSSPPSRPLTRRLVGGAILFGIGWGLVGLCPGPALVRLAFPDAAAVIFILAMFAGFEVQRRWL